MWYGFNTDRDNWDRSSTDSDYEKARHIIKKSKESEIDDELTYYLEPKLPFTHKFHKFPIKLTNLCFRCKKFGHFAKDCKNNYLRIKICFNCGKPGHIRPQCLELKKPF